MARVVGDIAVEVGADIAPLQRGMRGASRSVKGFDRDFDTMAKNIVRGGAAIAAGIAAATAGLGAMAVRAGETSRQIVTLSGIANAGTTEFQRMAQAARTVGIEQEKLSDILKDVNDRVGDFLATGGGPMADFFENIAPKVGVTAEQFARLSGPEALQLYVSSLEKAGASQQDMTFYLEAMASDVTALLPLLRDGGAEMARLGDEAQRSGRILGGDTLQAGVELDRTLGELAETLRTSVNTAILDNADDLTDLANVIATVIIPSVASLVGAFANLVSSIASVGEAAVTNTQKLLNFLNARDQAQQTVGGRGRKDRRDNGGGTSGGLSINISDFIGGDGTTTGSRGRRDRREGPLVYSGRGGDPRDFGMMGEILPPESGSGLGNVGGGGSSRGGGGGRGGGGRSAGPSERDLERLRESLMTERELLQENYDQQIEQLRGFRDAKMLTEDEYNELEKKTQADHQQAMLELERKRREATLQGFSGMFGDLASLMQTENKKLFAIGKAAAIAGATVDGISAAISAWDKGMDAGGPPVALAFTAASLARTGTMIAQLKSQTVNGGGGGGGASAAGGGAGAIPEAPPDRFVNINVSGNVGASGPMLIEQLNQLLKEGYRLRGVTTS